MIPFKSENNILGAGDSDKYMRFLSSMSLNPNDQTEISLNLIVWKDHMLKFERLKNILVHSYLFLHKILIHILSSYNLNIKKRADDAGWGPGADWARR